MKKRFLTRHPLRWFLLLWVAMAVAGSLIGGGVGGQNATTSGLYYAAHLPPAASNARLVIQQNVNPVPGAIALPSKESGLDTLLQAVQNAARGEMLLQPETMKRILDHAARRTSPPPHMQENSDFNLTTRELEVLAGIASGERSKEVGARLGITRRTVESYLNSIYTKLNVDSRTAAVAIAIERGLLSRRREET